MAPSKPAPTPDTYEVRDIYPNRAFTKAEQLRIATQISKLLTQPGSGIERTGKNDITGAR